MVLSSGTVPSVLFVPCLWLFFSFTLISGDQSDIDCVKKVHGALKDKEGYLYNWKFDRDYRKEGFICNFIGIECWHVNESRVVSIKLASMGLGGVFPLGLGDCKSITGLDLSNNHLSGPLPSNISQLIGNVTTLDLSSNKFDGPIPVELGNITYLNVLRLANNQFTGQIPAQLALLSRLKDFSVKNNLLSGPVPNLDGKNINASSYENNLGLCGKPLDPCKSPSKRNTGLIAGAAIGGVTFTAIVVGVGLFFYFRKAAAIRKAAKKEDDPAGNKWTKSLKGATSLQVSMFEDSVSKMRLSDLMKATNTFHKDNIIGSERTGTMYKGVLVDGTPLLIKRLQDSQHAEKDFRSEMATLGKVKHRNLLPLTGFCVANKERFLVYEYMSNGNLYDQLHSPAESRGPMDWPTRLKIALGSARGLTCLHHSCNPRILHRNISSKVILLNEDFEPKISSFGLSRLMNPVDTHLSTFVNGEFGDLGYVAPEYARTLKATPKGDIYSFGVVLLELLTGESPTRVSKAPENFKGSLVEWIRKLSTESNLRNAIDPSLTYNEEVFKVLKIAMNCILEEYNNRPTMYEVYQFLRVIGENYNLSTDDEILMPLDTEDGCNLEELIVAR